MGDKEELPLFFPEDMLQELQDVANRLDRSLSWCVQTAWRLHPEFIAALQPVSDGDADELPPAPPTGNDTVYGGEKVKQTVYVPTDMLREIQRVADASDHSLSWVVQHVWKRGVAELKAMPPPTGVDDAEPPKKRAAKKKPR